MIIKTAKKKENIKEDVILKKIKKKDQRIKKI